MAVVSQARYNPCFATRLYEESKFYEPTSIKFIHGSSFTRGSFIWGSLEVFSKKPMVAINSFTKTSKRLRGLNIAHLSIFSQNTVGECCSYLLYGHRISLLIEWQWTSHNKEWSKRTLLMMDYLRLVRLEDMQAWQIVVPKVGSEIYHKQCMQYVRNSLQKCVRRWYQRSSWQLVDMWAAFKWTDFK